MKKFLAALVLIALGAGWYFAFQARHSPPPKPAGGTTAVSETNPAAPARPENSAGVPPGSAAAGAGAIPPGVPAALPLPPAMEVSSLPPLTVLDNARVAMKNYNAAFGENPVGTNPEITEALMGKNPKQINFITAESGLRVNERGEMVDAWGTPFFFHQLSGQEMEIRSAGEDRKLWTFDDLVTR